MTHSLYFHCNEKGDETWELKWVRFKSYVTTTPNVFYV